MDYSLLFAIEKNTPGGHMSPRSSKIHTGTEKSSEKENFLQAHLQQSKYFYLTHDLFV